MVNKPTSHATGRSEGMDGETTMCATGGTLRGVAACLGEQLGKAGRIGVPGILLGVWAMTDGLRIGDPIHGCGDSCRARFRALKLRRIDPFATMGELNAMVVVWQAADGGGETNHPWRRTRDMSDLTPRPACVRVSV